MLLFKWYNYNNINYRKFDNAFKRLCGVHTFIVELIETIRHFVLFSFLRNGHLLLNNELTDYYD